MTQKKIMVFIGGYLPGEKYGGPVTSIFNFTQAMGDVFKIKIVCNNHDFKEKEPYSNITQGWNQVGKASVMYISEKKYTEKFFYELLKREKPDVIYTSGIMHITLNGPLILAARKREIPIVLVPRGDICDATIKIKRWKKIPFLWIMDKIKFFNDVYFQSTLQEETENLQKYLHVSSNNIFSIPNIHCFKTEKKREEKQVNKIKILFVSRIQSKKNLHYAIEVVSKMKSNVVFDIYGPIESSEYWEQCQLAIKSAPSNVQIEYKGALAPSEAKVIYCKYDCFLFPTQSENYGHVIVEAMLSNCPVVLSKETTPWDDIDGFGGYAIPLQQPENFTKRLDEIAQMDECQYEEILEKERRYTADKFNMKELIEKYTAMFNAVIRK